MFLLNHQYSEHSLRWPKLKGEDATRATLLRAAAERVGCDAASVLAEIQETWDVEYDDYPRRGRRGWSEWSGPDPDDVDALGSLIDSTIEIHPVDGRMVGGKAVAGTELASATPNVDLDPYDTEYTDHDPTEIERRSAMVTALLRFWPESVRHGEQRTLMTGALELAGRLGDADLAARLLDPFVIEALTPTDGPALAAAVEQHGRSWLEARLASWMNQRRNTRSDGLPARPGWTEALPSLCAHLLTHTDDDRAAPDAQRKTATLIVTGSRIGCAPRSKPRTG